MFTGRGEISSERLILMLLFLPCELSLEPWDEETVMRCVCCIVVLMHSTFIVMSFSTVKSNPHIGDAY